MELRLRDRVEAYITNVEMVLESVKGKVKEPYSVLLKLAEMYVSDAKYYLERGDEVTALACVAYAEGLLDSLRHLGVVKIDWKPLSELISRPKVVVAGTFDILHPGHIALLREAWLRGRVFVIVARDSNVRRFKGREPIIPESQRAEVVRAVRYVSRVVLGDEEDVLKPVEELKPDIVLLGPDQWADADWLAEALRSRGLSVRVERMQSKYECALCSVTDIVRRVKEVLSSWNPSD